MLIIALFRTASTSLKHSVSNIMGVGRGTYHAGSIYPCCHYPEFSKVTGQVGHIPKTELQQLVNDKKTLYKIHLVPCETNMTSLLHTTGKVVILLRDPKEFLSAMSRWYLSHGSNIIDGFFNQFDVCALQREAASFIDMYKKCIGNDRFLVIFFHTLIIAENQNNYIRAVCNHFDFNLDSDYNKYALAKKNYTGYSDNWINKGKKHDK